MRLVELSIQQFDEYAKFHPLNSYCQNSKYGLLMSNYNFNYEFIGLVDENNKIKAASLILIKKITGKTKYGYAPKGFLINYYDSGLLKEFLTLLSEYYKQRDVIFIKFNPEIIIGETNKEKKYTISYNGNTTIIDLLREFNVKRRQELQEFDLLYPKYNAYINLKNFSIENINRGHRKKLKRCILRGMSLEVGDVKQMDQYYKFIKGKTIKPISYYRSIYNIYNKSNSIDLVFIKIDYEKYLTNVKEKYEKESARNDEFNRQMQINPQNVKITQKINSDNKLQNLKNDVIKATEGLKKHKTNIIAGALIIKHANRISIISSGYSEEDKNLNPNIYLYYAIIERYKNYFNYCDMNGVSGKYDQESKYYSLNDFKLKWNPTIYEFIGEFDLVCNDHIFKKLMATSFIEDEFTKQNY